MRCRCKKDFNTAGLQYFEGSHFCFKKTLLSDNKYAFFILGDEKGTNNKIWYRLYHNEFKEYFEIDIKLERKLKLNKLNGIF